MYKSLDVVNSGEGVVCNSVVYKYSDPPNLPSNPLHTGHGAPNCTKRKIIPSNSIHPELKAALSLSLFPSLPQHCLASRRMMLAAATTSAKRNMQ